MVEVGLSPDVFAGRVGDAVPRAGEGDFEVRENGSSPAWPNNALLFPAKENLLTSFACDIPAPCETGPKLKPVDPDAKEKALLVFCSAELAGATETSVLEGWPNTKPPCEVFVLSVGIFGIPWGGFRLA